MLKKNFIKRDLSNKVYKNLGFSKNISLTIVTDFFEFLISELMKSNKIKISSFGTFKVINTKERTGRNPKTKIEAKILPRKVVKFKPSSFVKKEINR